MITVLTGVMLLGFLIAAGLGILSAPKPNSALSRIISVGLAALISMQK